MTTFESTMLIAEFFTALFILVGLIISIYEKFYIPSNFNKNRCIKNRAKYLLIKAFENNSDIIKYESLNDILSQEDIFVFDFLTAGPWISSGTIAKVKSDHILPHFDLMVSNEFTAYKLRLLIKYPDAENSNNYKKRLKSFKKNLNI